MKCITKNPKPAEVNASDWAHTLGAELYVQIKNDNVAFYGLDGGYSYLWDGQNLIDLDMYELLRDYLMRKGYIHQSYPRAKILVSAMVKSAWTNLTKPDITEQDLESVAFFTAAPRKWLAYYKLNECLKRKALQQ